jgi:hypothetical protein
MHQREIHAMQRVMQCMQYNARNAANAMQCNAMQCNVLKSVRPYGMNNQFFFFFFKKKKYKKMTKSC